MTEMVSSSAEAPLTEGRTFTYTCLWSYVITEHTFKEIQINVVLVFFLYMTSCVRHAHCV